jgi:hypothetical protein
LIKWKGALKRNGKCIFILGDSYCKSLKLPLPQVIENIAVNEVGGYKLFFKMENIIPDSKRVRRHHKGNVSETILIFERTV